ncbi:MAG: LytR/AlgR family response regulator transcription factor [Sarcina sp.]
MKVFLCEDNPKQRAQFKKIIENKILINNFDMNLELETGSPYDLLEYSKQNNEIGIYFLDVDLRSTINGIELAQKIRMYDTNGVIIFLTSHSELTFMALTAKVEAMDFIVKDSYKNIAEKIEACLDYASKKYSNKKNESKVFTIEVDDKIINLRYNEILYFETSMTIHKVIAHCANRSIEFYGRMKKIDNLLNEHNFIRCHTSYIVNKEFIKEVDKKNRILYIVDGRSCLISTRGLKKVI